MSYPSDVLLPINSKYYGFVDSKFPYNSHWDITWSFSFALTGSQHGFCTFLTTNPLLSSGVPGQYLGYLGSNSPYYDRNGILAIAFDSTGYFGLSNSSNSGVSRSNTKANSIVVRDSSNNVVYNQSLSSLDTNFFLASSYKNYQTLRFRLSNAGKKLYIDKKYNDTYTNLVDLTLSFNTSSYPVLYPGITFCSPISSSSIQPSTLFLKNFHTQGNLSDPTYETVSCIPLSTSNPTIYTTISSIL